jgi:hypothetical protein
MESRRVGPSIPISCVEVGFEGTAVEPGSRTAYEIAVPVGARSWMLSQPQISSARRSGLKERIDPTTITQWYHSKKQEAPFYSSSSLANLRTWMLTDCCITFR